MATMYDRIEELCRQGGTNITAMCRQLGIARSALSELKTGRTKSLSYDTISAIAHYFHVSPDYVAGKTNQKAAATDEDNELQEYLDELRNRPEQRALLSITKNATREDVERAVKIVDALLSKGDL